MVEGPHRHHASQQILGVWDFSNLMDVQPVEVIMDGLQQLVDAPVLVPCTPCGAGALQHQHGSSSDVLYGLRSSSSSGTASTEVPPVSWCTSVGAVAGLTVLN
jgi:hypothetical protein